MSDFFKTVKGISQGLYKEKMSKFISFAEPVQSADEAKAVIKKYQNQYHDARHVCWAYMIGTDRSEYLSSDNGEPSGTAGKPILGQINSFGLTNIVIVVVRYFGGINWGHRDPTAKPQPKPSMPARYWNVTSKPPLHSHSPILA